jgi:PAS domain S-box-containing protein
MGSTHLETLPAEDLAADLEALRRVNPLTGVDLTQLPEQEPAGHLYKHFAAIIESSDDAIISKDLDGVIRSWNNGAERIFGYSAQEVIGQSVTILMPAGRENEEPEILARIRRGERIDHYETVRKRKDGTLVDISLTVSPVKDGSGRIVGASKIARDITERKQAAKRMATQYAITQALAQSAGLLEAAPKLIRILCESAGWETGAAWQANKVDGHLRCLEFVNCSSKPFPQFEAVTRGGTFPSGIGLPGRVWRTGSPSWIPDIARDGNFPRTAVGVSEGLHGAIAFPIGVPGEVLGVMEFFSEEIREPEKALLELLAGFGSQIGQFAQRKRAEETLRENERRFREMIDALPAAIYTTDAEGRLTHFNPAAVEFSGRVPELGTQHWCLSWKLFRADGTPMPHEDCPMAVALKEGRIVRGAEAIAERPDGRRIWFTPYPTPLHDAAGTVVGGINMLVDISERKRAEEQVRQSEERFRSLVSVITDVPWVADPSGAFVAPQPAWEVYTGQTWEEHRGFGWANALHPDDRKRTKEAWQYACKSNTVYRSEGRLWHTATRQWRHFVARAVPLFKPDGTLREWMGAYTDCEDQKRAKEMLEQTVAERTAKLRETIGELEAFSYSITHDLRAPLRALQSFSIILEQEQAAKLDAAAKDYLHRIATSAHRMDKLIQDVLTYSQVLRTDLELEPVDVSKLLRGMIESYPNFQEAKMEITIDQDLPRVLGNEAALTQCLSNLLTNAGKFVAPGTKPRVRISAERFVLQPQSQSERPRQATANRGCQRNKRIIRIWVADNGVGIAERHWGKIFGMFHRLDAHYEGTGIGLSIVRKAMERMGGKVGVESELGKGSQFWLELEEA